MPNTSIFKRKQTGKKNNESRESKKAVKVPSKNNQWGHDIAPSKFGFYGASNIDTLTRIFAEEKLAKPPKISRPNEAFRVVLIGCGNGAEIIPVKRWLSTFYGNDVQILALDISQRAISAAQKIFSKRESVKFACIDATNFTEVQNEISRHFKTYKVDMVIYPMPSLDPNSLAVKICARTKQLTDFQKIIPHLTSLILAEGGSILGSFQNQSERQSFNNLLTGILQNPPEKFITGSRKNSCIKRTCGLPHSEWLLVTDCEFKSPEKIKIIAVKPKPYPRAIINAGLVGGIMTFGYLGGYVLGRVSNNIPASETEEIIFNAAKKLIFGR